MAWIKTIQYTEAGEALRAALEAQHRLYPKEYARDPNDDGRFGAAEAAETLALSLPSSVDSLHDPI